MFNATSTDICNMACYKCVMRNVMKQAMLHVTRCLMFNATSTDFCNMACNVTRNAACYEACNNVLTRTGTHADLASGPTLSSYNQHPTVTLSVFLFG